MWNVAHSSRFSSIQATVRSKTSRVVVEAEHEAAVDLDAVVVQERDAPRVVVGCRRVLARVGEVVVGERLEPDEHARAAGQRHLADQRRVVGHVDRDGGAPDLPQRPERLAERAQVVGPEPRLLSTKTA